MRKFFVGFIATLVMFTSCGVRDERDKQSKSSALYGTWVSKQNDCNGSRCYCTDVISFNKGGVFLGRESCSINGEKKTGNYGGIYTVSDSWIKMEYYDGRGEYYNYFTVYENKLELIVNNKIKVYLKGGFLVDESTPL